MIVCQLDQTEHESLEALHKHLQFKLKVKQETYYTQFPRLDLCTGEPIPFKLPAERYLRTEFRNKNNLKRYLKEKPVEGKAWAVNWLARRKADKGLVYPPSQVELRSLMCPSALYYDHVGGYGTICGQLGYTIRYDGTLPTAGPTDFTVIVDTREQDPLRLSVPITRAKLTCGDYGLTPERDKGVYIERKSLPDFVGTLSDRGGANSNLARFTRELERVVETNGYLIMLVESSLTDALSFSYLPHMSHCRVKEEHIFKNLRDLLVRFPLHFQALFVAGRTEAKAAVPRLLQAGEAVKRTDLQLAYEKGELTFG
jgi:hypothetical protein